MTEEVKPDPPVEGEAPKEVVGEEGAPVEGVDPAAATVDPEKPKDEDGLPEAPVEKPWKSNIPDEKREDMKNLWGVFDTETTNAVAMSHLGTILRALDIDVPEDQLAALA